MGKGLEKFQNEMKAEVEKNKKNENLAASLRKVLKHIREVCDDEYDALLAQEHKSFQKAWKYVTEKARKHAFNGCAMIEDETVYGWFDEYVGLDDKEACEKEKKRDEEEKKRMEVHPAIPTPAPKPKKEDNQLTMFDI